MINQSVFSSNSQLFQNRLQHLKLEVNSSSYFHQSWRLFWDNSGLFIPYTILLLIVCAGISFIPVIGQIIVGVMYPLLAAGYFVVTLKLIRGDKAEMSDFFKALSQWYPLSINGLLGGIMTAVGFLCLIIPGIYLYFAYLFSVQLIVDENLTGWESLEASRKVLTKIFFPFSLFTLLTYFVVVLGVLALGIGLVVTFPLYFIMHAFAYEDIRKQIQSQI
ncbi:MAG: hypothetical protein ACOYL6_15570 [Bacteriovoracaceae bacterium]